jgi:hypothetical protein
MHNMYEAYYRVYASLNIRDIDGILRPQNSQMPKDPASENADVMDGMTLKAFAGQQHDAHIASHLMMGLSPLIQTIPMAAMELQKHILQHVRIKAEEDVEAELFVQYGKDPDRMVSAIQKEGMVALKIAQYMQEVRSLQSQLGGGEGPDPVVALKAEELKIRDEDNKRDNAIAEQRLQLDAQKAAQTAQANQARVNSQENIAQLRANIARERVAQISQQQGKKPNAA